MKKFRLQEGLTWICFRCGKKIKSKGDMAWYERRIYHRGCAMSLIEKIKNKLFKKMIGDKK